VQTAPLAERERLDALIEERLRVPEAQVTEYLSHEAYQTIGWHEVDDLLRRGFSVGSHSRTHASLSQVDDARLADEVAGSLRDLIDHAGGRELPFAYPYGQAEHLSDAAVEAVRSAGYSCAVTMLRGVNTPATDLFTLRRVTYRDLAKAEAP
jgi:peptidoglycan/xylan/chitin deacetylase (PgdA/CDA1 family)